MTHVSFPSKLCLYAWETIYWEQWSPADSNTLMVVLTPPLKTHWTAPWLTDHYLSTDPGGFVTPSIVVSCRLYTPLLSLSLWLSAHSKFIPFFYWVSLSPPQKCLLHLFVRIFYNISFSSSTFWCLHRPFTPQEIYPFILRTRQIWLKWSIFSNNNFFWGGGIYKILTKLNYKSMLVKLSIFCQFVFIIRNYFPLLIAWQSST